MPIAAREKAQGKGRHLKDCFLTLDQGSLTMMLLLRAHLTVAPSLVEATEETTAFFASQLLAKMEMICTT